MIFVPQPGAPTDYQQMRRRMQQAEQALELTIDGLQSVIQRLETLLGPDFLGQDLQHLSAAASEAEAVSIVEQVTQLVKQEQSGPAARILRDALGCSWDEAHLTVRQWNHFHRRQQERWVRLARYIRSLSSHADR